MRRLRRKELDVFVVLSDPAPENAALEVFAEGAIATANSHRPVASGLLQMKRWMPRILFQQFVILTGELLNLRGKLAEELPEIRAGEVTQISRLLPAR